MPAKPKGKDKARSDKATETALRLAKEAKEAIAAHNARLKSIEPPAAGEGSQSPVRRMSAPASPRTPTTLQRATSGSSTNRGISSSSSPAAEFEYLQKEYTQKQQVLVRLIILSPRPSMCAGDAGRSSPGQ